MPDDVIEQTLSDMLMGMPEGRERQMVIEQWMDDNSIDVGEMRLHGMGERTSFRKIDYRGQRWLYEDIRNSKRSMSGSINAVDDHFFPDSLTKHTDNVLFTSQVNSKDAYWSKKYGISDFKALATGGDGSIVVYGDNMIGTSTYSHEMGHNLALRRYGMSAPPIGTDYGDAWESWRTSAIGDASIEAPVSSYAENAVYEDFAESVEMYFEFPTTMQGIAPNRFSIIKQLLENEAYGG